MDRNFRNRRWFQKGSQVQNSNPYNPHNPYITDNHPEP